MSLKIKFDSISSVLKNIAFVPNENRKSIRESNGMGVRGE